MTTKRKLIQEWTKLKIENPELYKKKIMLCMKIGEIKLRKKQDVDQEERQKLTKPFLGKKRMTKKNMEKSHN